MSFYSSCASAKARKAASSLALVLLDGPTIGNEKHCLAVGMRHGGRWDELVAQLHHCGQEEVIAIDPSERLAMNGKREPAGLLSLAASWLCSSRDQPPARMDMASHPCEKVVLALMDRGVRPLDPTEHRFLVKTALSQNALALFDKCLSLDGLQTRAVAKDWLVQEHRFSRQFFGPGFFQLAWCGYGKMLERVLDEQLIDINYQDKHGRNASASLLHGRMLDILARRGLDPHAQDRLGRLMPQNWPETTANTQKYISLRNAWERNFGVLGSLPSSADLSRRMLLHCVLNNPRHFLEYHLETAGIAPGSLIDGKDLSEVVRAQSLHKIPYITMPRACSDLLTAQMLWQHADPARMLDTGLSSGFSYALSQLPTPWSHLRREGFYRSPECVLSLSRQWALVRQFAAATGQAVNEPAGFWWGCINEPSPCREMAVDRIGRKETKLPSLAARMEFVLTPDDTDFLCRPPIAQEWMKGNLDRLLTRLLDEHGGFKQELEILSSLPGQDVWMALLLARVPALCDTCKSDPSHNHLPMPSIEAGARSAMRWLSVLIDRGCSPHAFLFQPPDLASLTSKASSELAVLWDRLRLGVATLSSPSRPRARL